MTASGRARLLLTAIPIAIAGGALDATILRPKSTPALIAALLAGAITSGLVAAIAANQHLLFILVGEVSVVMVGGPLSAGLVVAVQAMVDSKGGAETLLIGPLVFGVLGIVFGAFITIPVGLAFGSLCTGWAAIARRITGPPTEPSGSLPR